MIHANNITKGFEMTITLEEKLPWLFKKIEGILKWTKEEIGRSINITLNDSSDNLHTYCHKIKSLEYFDLIADPEPVKQQHQPRQEEKEKPKLSETYKLDYIPLENFIDKYKFVSRSMIRKFIKDEKLSSLIINDRLCIYPQELVCFFYKNKYKIVRVYNNLISFSELIPELKEMCLAIELGRL